MPMVEIIVKIDDAFQGKISQIADECKTAGMSVEQQMSAIGMISGKIERAGISKLEQIAGVSYVEEATAI